MSNSAQCDLNFNGRLLKLHDKCPEATATKQITFTPEQSDLEGSGFESNLKQVFEGTENACNKLLWPALNVTVTFWKCCGTKPKGPKVGRANTICSECNLGAKIFSLKDTHGNGNPLRVLSFYFKQNIFLSNDKFN